MAVASVNVGAFGADRFAGLFGGDLRGLPGHVDFIRRAISSAALMFLPLRQDRRGHVAVDPFLSRLAPGVGRALDRLWLPSLAGLALRLACWMVLGLLETRADNGLSPVCGWPEWPFHPPGVVSPPLRAAIAAAQIADGPDASDRTAKDA